MQISFHKYFISLDLLRLSVRNCIKRSELFDHFYEILMRKNDILVIFLSQNSVYIKFHDNTLCG